MKKWLMSALLCICLTASGCSAPHLDNRFAVADGSIPVPEITPAPTVEPAATASTLLGDPASVEAVVYDPERAPTALEDGEGFSRALYALLADSIRAGLDSVELGQMEVSDEQFSGVRQALVSRNAWGALSDIVLDADGRVKLTYSVADPAERVQRAQRFDEAAQRLLEGSIEPGQSQLAAALSLYKAVAQSVVMDNEAEETGLYGALALGCGTDFAFAYAYGFLLDQAGIDNVVVTSEDGSHAWNVLNIGQASFHCDPGMESGLNGGQALQCFGLSDADVARRNGWNTWSGENRELLTCPETLMPELTEAPCADVDAAGNAVYFNRIKDMDGLFRLDLATGEVLQIEQVQTDALAVLGKDVYYLSDGVLRCYRTGDGQTRDALEGVRVQSIRRVGDEVRYVVSDDPDGAEHALSLE